MQSKIANVSINIFNTLTLLRAINTFGPQSMKPFRSENLPGLCTLSVKQGTNTVALSRCYSFDLLNLNRSININFSIRLMISLRWTSKLFVEVRNVLEREKINFTSSTKRLENVKPFCIQSDLTFYECKISLLWLIVSLLWVFYDLEWM